MLKVVGASWYKTKIGSLIVLAAIILGLGALFIIDMESDEDISENDKRNTDLHSKVEQPDKTIPLSPGKIMLKSWLNRNFRIVMTDGRILVGVFLCTDSDANVILGMCSEYTEEGGEERILGLVMIPGRHIVSMEVDMSGQQYEA